jgi:hypothetical protein
MLAQLLELMQAHIIIREVQFSKQDCSFSAIWA